MLGIHQRYIHPVGKLQAYYVAQVALYCNLRCLDNFVGQWLLHADYM